MNVYVPIPGTCFNAIAPASANGATAILTTGDSASVPPVQIMVSAHEPNGPNESVQVQVLGQLAGIMAVYHGQGSR